MFWDLPSEELLRQIIFEPSRVPRAWIVFVNYLLLAAPRLYGGDTGLSNMWRWNAKVALEKPIMFLESSKINIQTLMLLAVHSEDFSSPNLSWMLTSHACRQTQGLALHARPANVDDETWQRQLTLFWNLFGVEKWCALAFGRPCFLPYSLYRDVPTPSFEHLAGFKPHLRDPTVKSAFGAHVFLRLIELAKITGTILETLAVEHTQNAVAELKSRLEDWYHTTVDVCALHSTPPRERNYSG